MKVGVTGANGFVGQHLIQRLDKAGHDVTALVRNKASMLGSTTCSIVEIPSLNSRVDIQDLVVILAELDVLIHLAGHVHKMNDADDDASFHDVNVVGSERLFEAADTADVKRFIFLSSVKAAGERSNNMPLTLENSPGPEDAYGRSKQDAEQALQDMARETNCDLAILRATFVYGWPPVGNFKSVISAVKKGIPLPLASIHNHRHMVFVGNLADALCHSSVVDGLSSAPYFIADDQPVSTPELFRLTGQAFASPARLFPMPLWMLRMAGILTGRSSTIARLTENLEVDTAPFRRDASWFPPYNMSEGLSLSANMDNPSTEDRK